MGRIWKVLTRKKAIDPVAAEETRLNRILNTFDLTALGVGSTLGVGVYVLAGQVAKDTAGPSVVLSFLIAAVASVFAGLCYAEFGARAPRAGSAYIYSYVCVGEFIAFVIGWNLILEYVIGSASVARGLSLYLDTLINNTLQDTFREIAPINVNFLSPYFDFFSFGVSILLAIALAFGLKESSMANNIVTGLNILVVLFVVIAGSIKADSANWNISPNSTNTSNSTNIGKGGFFPFGVEGMIKGAATCFYGFVGFDCIATTGEEVKNPRKAIPISIIVSLFIIFLAYFGVSTVLTLMVPYYLQDHNAPIPRAFEMIGWEWAKWIVAIGALFGLCASLFGAMFPLPRIIYAMGSDGLVFKFLAKVSPKFQTPVIGTLVAGILTGLMSAIFDLRQLVNMMSIGTLLAYTIVAASVLLLRYKGELKKVYVPIKTSSDTESTSSESSVDDRYNDDGIRQNFDGPTTSDEQELINTESVTCSRSLKYIFNFGRKEPNRITENIVAVEVFLYCILCVGIGLCAIYLKTPMTNGEVWAISITSVIVGLTVILMMSLATQPTSKKELSFKVPFVPIIPALSILVNIYLMLMLDFRTWIRFAVWMAVGIPMYCMCACSQKQPHSQQNGSKYTTNITNGHAKMSNGISNPTFVQTETNGNETREKIIKKKALAPPPPVNDPKENIEVQQEAVIAQLDEILDKEVAIAQLDDILNDETIINDRKLSAGTLSNMSAVVSRFEDVVADVHRANVSTPVANPKSHPIPSVVDNPIVLNNTTSSSSNAVTGKNEVLDEPLFDYSPINSKDPNINENKASPNLEGILGDDKVSPKENSANNSNDDGNKIQNVDTDELNNTSEKSSDDPTENVDLSIADALHQGNKPVPITSIEPTDEKSKNLISNDNSNENKVKEAPLSTKDSEHPVEEKADNSPKVSFAELTQTQYEEPASPSTVPTKEALKSVTLRHVKKQIKEIEKSNNENASNDNLRVGSEEYKNFIKNLDNKLKRVTVIPNIYPLPRKDIIVQPKKADVPNENVIEEKINQEDAKEKLKSFMETSLLGGNEQKPETKLGSPRKLLKNDERSKSVNDIEKSLIKTKTVLKDLNKAEEVLDKIKSSNGNTTHEPVDNDDDNSSVSPDSDHKLKMENVFRSIQLRKPETKGDHHLKRRLSKSLGRSFGKEEDESEHRHKMSDIFKSIEAIPKQGLSNEKAN